MTHGLILSLLSALCYGMSPILYKLGFREGLCVLDMLSLRFLIASVLFLVFVLVSDRSLLKASWSLLAKAAFTGMILYLLQSYFFIKALEYIPAATTSLILYLYPVTVTLLSLIFLGFRLTRILVLALIFPIIGVALVSLDALYGTFNPLGILFAFGAMLVFSVYMITVQIVVKTDRPFTFTLYVFFFVTLAYCLIHPPTAVINLNLKQSAICILLGLVPTALAVPLLYKAIEKVGSATAAIFSTFEPVATLIAAALILHEQITLLQLLGMVLIVAGIIIPNAHQISLRKRFLPNH